MELQQTSPTRSRRSSRQPASTAIGWGPLDLARLGCMGLVVAGPWYFAGAPWYSQYWMVWVSLALALLMTCEVVRRLWQKRDTSKVAIPALSLIFLGLAGYGWVQSLPLFSVASEGGWAPSSVEIQRWFLGTSNADLDAQFKTAANIPAASSEHLVSKAWFENARLALSVEPLHSRAAVGGMAMVSVMIWIGASAFQTRRSQFALLILMTVMGVAVGLVGLAHVLSWDRVNWLGLDSGNSFATFVSRNTAGGFLNVCLAASVGLAAMAFSQSKDKEHRYSYGTESPGLRILHTIEDLFAQLTTMQISALLAMSFILIAVICTGSRGASISAVVACTLALLVSQNKKNKVGVWVFALFVIGIGLTGIYAFELDQRITSRFSELTKAETLEADVHVGRIYIWAVALKAFLYYGVLGSGLGTFHFAHLPFQNPLSTGWYYHAESLYAQALVEMGWIGAIAIIAFSALSVRAIATLGKARTIVNPKSKHDAERNQSMFLIGLTLVIGQSIHSIFDFALIVPAVFLSASLLIGMIYGAARNKSLTEKVGTESGADTEHLGKRSQRLPRMEGPRFANLRESDPAVVTSAPKRNGTKQTMITLVVSIGMAWLLWSSLHPIDAMVRVDSMNRWLQDQSKVARAARMGSPSAYLAGLWGRPNISIYQVPDALRMLGESVLYEFRTQRIDQYDSLPNERNPVSWESTSPLIVRLAISEKEAEAKSKGTDRAAFSKSTDFDTLIGGSMQLLRWNKAQELIERAHLQSPLDWRLVWGRLLLDREMNIEKWNGWFDRSRLVSRHRPETLFQIGVLAWQAAKDREQVFPLWELAMQVSPSLTSSVASIIAMSTSDADVPDQIFPANASYLHAIVLSPFDATKFPITNEKLWRKISEAAHNMNPNDRTRYMWLASAAAHFGDTLKELEYLGELVNRSPMDRQLRMQFAERLADMKQFESAIEHAEICRSLAPNDPQIDASLKRLKTLASQAEQRE